MLELVYLLMDLLEIILKSMLSKKLQRLQVFVLKVGLVLVNINSLMLLLIVMYWPCLLLLARKVPFIALIL
jgi:hypothetical protein